MNVRLAGTAPIDHDEHGPFRLLGFKHTLRAVTLRWNGESWRKGIDHDPLPELTRKLAALGIHGFEPLGES